MTTRVLQITALAIIAVACARTTRIGHYIGQRLATLPPEGPTCYRGNIQFYAVLPGWLRASPSPRWLVLDPRPAEEREGYAVGYVIGPDGHKRPMPIFVRWRRVADSIEVHETNPFPPASWMFAEHGDTLMGRGMMIHDIVEHDSTGQLANRRSDWQARAHRVPCTQVP